MAAPDRAGERRSLRLLGASVAQVLRVWTLEVLIAFAVGVALAGLCFAVSTAGLWPAPLRVAGPLPVPVPWPILGVVVAGTAGLAVVVTGVADAPRRPGLGRPAGRR